MMKLIRTIAITFRESREYRCTEVSHTLQSGMASVVKHLENIAETKPIEIKLHGTDSATKLWRYYSCVFLTLLYLFQTIFFLVN